MDSRFLFGSPDANSLISIIIDSNASNLNYFFAAQNGSIWLKALFLLRMNRIVGPLLKIILELARDFFNFFSIFMLTLLTFACVGVIMFSNLDGFSYFSKSIVTLLSWTLGSFSYSEI